MSANKMKVTDFCTILMEKGFIDMMAIVNLFLIRSLTGRSQIAEKGDLILRKPANKNASLASD